jgi:ribosomal protein L37AE/L43A
VINQFDPCVMVIGNKHCFRPGNHPLHSVICCKKCKAPTVSLPAYPTDYFDCETCGYSWAPTEKQMTKMYRGAIKRERKTPSQCKFGGFT